MVAVSETKSRHKLFRGAALIAVVLPMALLAACSQPAPPPPAPVSYQPAPAPMSPPPMVPAARG